jgi:hypothetical protein
MGALVHEAAHGQKRQPEAPPRGARTAAWHARLMASLQPIVWAPASLPAFVPGLPSATPAGPIRLNASTPPDEIALVVALLVEHVGAQDVASFEALLEVFPSIVSGGLRASDDDHEITPGCCCGLEMWREWHLLLSSSQSPWLGHDPDAWVEIQGDTFIVWSDGPEGHGVAGGALESVRFTRAELGAALGAVEADLRGFLERLRSWGNDIQPGLGNSLSHHFAQAFVEPPGADVHSGYSVKRAPSM